MTEHRQKHVGLKRSRNMTASSDDTPERPNKVVATKPSGRSIEEEIRELIKILAQQNAANTTIILPSTSFQVRGQQNLRVIIQNDEDKVEEVEDNTQETTDNRTLHERLDNIESEFKKMNEMLETILKHIQPAYVTAQRPLCLPISSLEELEDFENIDDDTYSSVVKYLQTVGGVNLKEAVNLYFKEVLKDDIITHCTWGGRDQHQRGLCNARIIMAIYDAVFRNRHISEPTLSEFQTLMKEAVRAAKERVRSRTRGSRSVKVHSKIDKDFWNNDRPE